MTLIICRAGAVGQQPAPDLDVRSRAGIEDLRPEQRPQRMATDAVMLARELRRSLPQGTLDRLLTELLRGATSDRLAPAEFEVEPKGGDP